MGAHCHAAAALTLVLASAVPASTKAEVRIGGTFNLNVAKASTNEGFRDAVASGLRDMFGSDVASVDATLIPAAGIGIGSITRPGFGAVVEFQLKPSLSLMTGLNVIGKGGRVNDASSFAIWYSSVQASNSFDVKTTYIEVPLQLKYSFAVGRIRPYLLAGPLVGFRSGDADVIGHVTGEEPIVPASPTPPLPGASPLPVVPVALSATWSGSGNVQELREVDLGCGAGVGVTVPFGKSVQVFAEGQYVVAFSSAIGPSSRLVMTYRTESTTFDGMKVDPAVNYGSFNLNTIASFGSGSSWKDNGFRARFGVTFRLGQ